ncbi:MAG: hypothetical protein GTN78_05370 [Gemmatimonadales bacterium]|nr:hypothetical protein [Gemmatimonadales bacterium]NIN12725.1 hypothetical protein [Gemmatimonadales bacterium]NIQ99616.1 hypothetical protein [Gemmatimonadales bacterium]NIS64173.1 hypothetical protein [Gemmatimonadales bacterium]
MKPLPRRRRTASTVFLMLGCALFTACDLQPTEPEPVATTSVVAGAFHGCWLSSAGEAFCWGDNGAGQVGAGSFQRQRVPALVAGGLTFRALEAGGFHSCGATEDGAVHCWGGNGTGALGDASTTGRSAPVLTTGGVAFEQIDAGGLHTCGLTDEGVAYCWGFNGGGQAGVRVSGSICGGSPCFLTPTRLESNLLFASLSAGLSHTCGITRDSVAYCWGSNQNGQLGNGVRTSVPQPVLVAGGLKFISVQAGGAHTCALTTEGVAYCWGLNHAGQLGTEESTETCGPLPCATRPVPVQTMARFHALTAGADHTCGLTAEGAAYCWGRNDWGQLGNGTIVSESTPHPVSGGHRFLTISGGDSHTCATTTSGEAYCWGDNLLFQLGNGGVGIRRSTPSRVALPGSD